MKAKVLVLGEVGIQTEAGLQTAFRTASTRRVLLHLALRGDRLVRRTELAQLVWPEHTEMSARTSLRTALAWLRKAGVELGGDKEWVSLKSDTDLAQFRRLIRAGDRMGACLAYKGLFAHGEPDPILAQEGEALENDFLNALREGGAAAMKGVSLDHLVFSAPEVARRAQDYARGTNRATSYGTPDAAHPYPLIGRTALLGQILDALASERWLTLVAPGGSGKTRLALEVARRTVDAGSSALWVSLEGRSGSNDWVQMMREALGLESVAGLDPGVQLEHFLSVGNWLVVVDGAEGQGSIVAAIAQLSNRIRNLSVLFTSRHALDGVPGTTVAVPTLETSPGSDGTEVAAILLLKYFAKIHLAHEAVPDRVVQDLASRLGGHPLALLLAAAQLGRDWSPSRVTQLQT